MSKISQDSIERVAAANDIVDVIGSYFPLKRAGTNFRALCPFHREKSPSFHVNPIRQSFHCFGCGAGGGVFRFVMDYEHVDFPNAVRRLAQRAGVPLLEESDSKDGASRDARSRLLELHRKAAGWFHRNLLRSAASVAARDYLKSRGFTKEIAVTWQLGYAPSSWDDLKTWALVEGFTQSELIEGGLIIPRERGETYDRFRHRLMFPICNDYGDVIAFSGRTLSSDDKEAKYVNSPETPIFSKGRILFGINKSKRALIQKGEAIVLEGQIDLIMAFEHGFQNVVAPQGTAFTADQARLLRRFVERVVLCFDSDAAGKKAVERSLPELFASGCEVRIARLPEGEDPDSMIRKQGVEAFRKIISDAKDFFNDAIDTAITHAAGSMGPGEVALLAKQLGGYLMLLPDATLREITSSSVAARLGISIAALKSSAAKIMLPSQESSEVAVQLMPLKISAGTELLCRLAFFHEEVRDWLRLQKNPFPHELDGELLLLEELLEQLSFSTETSVAVVLAQLSPNMQQLVSSWNLEKAVSDPLEKAKDAWVGFQLAYWKSLQATLTAGLKKPNIQNHEIIQIQKEILDLQRKMNEVSGSIKVLITNKK
ncbi:MAG: DNA primase [Chthoniobacterales bacterium]